MPPGFAALCSLASSHLKPIPGVTRRLLIWNQLTIFQGLTLLFELNRLILPWLPNLIPPFSLFIVCLLSSPFSLLSLWVSRLLILIPKSASLSLGFHLHRFSYYLLSEKYTGFLLIPGLFPRTPDSYFQWPAGRLHLQLQDNWTTGQSWNWNSVRLEFYLLISEAGSYRNQVASISVLLHVMQKYVTILIMTTN